MGGRRHRASGARIGADRPALALAPSRIDLPANGFPRPLLALFVQLKSRECPILCLGRVVELDVSRLDQHGHQVVHRGPEIENCETGPCRCGCSIFLGGATTCADMIIVPDKATTPKIEAA